MVRRYRLALAGLAVDLGPDHAGLQRRRNEQMIDSHSEVLMKVASAIVPPGVTSGFGMPQAVSVNESGTGKTRERLAFARGDVCSTVTGARIPDVGILRRDIEVTAQHSGCFCVDIFVKP